MTHQGPTRPAAELEDLAGKEVTVVGLGRFGGGICVTRWLWAQGAKVTVTDIAEPSELTESVKALKGLDVTLHLGRHDEQDFLKAELLVVNPAVPKNIPELLAAESAGIRRTSEINLFMERCCAEVIGVTGSVGKSTTAAMIGAIVESHRKTHVGGNIGRSLLQDLSQIRPDHVVVLELSSFQLEDLPLIGISPHIAVVTNILPNHLDRHGTMEAYVEAKKNIFRFQTKNDMLILNRTCPSSVKWADEAPGHVKLFDPHDLPFLLSVPGPHNQANAQAAWAVAEQFGIPRESASRALSAFAGLDHRLQFVAESEGVKYYNDSKSTTPTGAVAALGAFEAGKTIIIAGGYDKGLDFDQLGEVMAQRAKAVITMGATARKILAAVQRHSTGRCPSSTEVKDLSEAISQARKLTDSGDVVVLSPACASYDTFRNYEERGQLFVRLVNQYARGSQT